MTTPAVALTPSDAGTVPVLASFQDDLARLEASLRDTSGVDYPALAELLDWIFGSGGKRIRPALVFAVARLGHGQEAAVLNLAAAVETLHAATLIHDDLVDDSALRRGRPTLNTRWSAGATVLAGDWLFARAARFTVGVRSLRVMDGFARSLGAITDGELRQLFGRRGVPTIEEYEYRIYAKTAALFEAATEGGAVLAGLPEPQVQALLVFGRELGIAFQIVDDALDFSGDPDRLGKPVGHDLRDGTVTLPVLLYLEGHPEAAAWLGGNGADAAADVERLIEAVRVGPTVAASLAVARERVTRAVEALEVVPTSPARADLARLAWYVVERDA